MLSTVMSLPTPARYFIGGHSVQREGDQVRKIIGVCPQDLGPLSGALGNGTTSCSSARWPASAAARPTTKSRLNLELVGLSDRAKDRVDKFSGGMKRRVNLAIALMSRPALLFLDEPTVGIDPQSRNHIFETILALRAEGQTILYTTHYMEEADRLCDRLGIIDNGRRHSRGLADRAKIADRLAGRGDPGGSFPEPHRPQPAGLIDAAPVAHSCLGGQALRC